MRLTIAFLTLCYASTLSYSAEISGPWKIDTHGGPAPLCKLVQTGNNLSGSCVGPQATGTVTGTVVGPTVRWRWQWVTHVGSKPGAFDFVGTLGSDNTIIGTLERREIGLLVNFTTKKQTPFAGAPTQFPGNKPWPASLLANDLPNAEEAANAHHGYASQRGYRTVIDPYSVGTGHPRYSWQRIPPRSTEPGPFDQFDPQDVATALAMFPSQGPRMWQWLKDQKNINLDRQQGNSYSLGVR